MAGDLYRRNAGRDIEGGVSRRDDPGEPSTNLPRISVADDELVLLRVFGMGKQVLEIGTGLGVATRALATYADLIVTYDIDPWVHDTIWPELRELDNVIPVAHAPRHRDFTLCFIDGDHRPDAFHRDVEFALARVRPGGMLVAHDAKELADELDDKWTTIPTTYGLAWRVA